MQRNFGQPVIVPPGKTARTAPMGVRLTLDGHQLIHTHRARLAYAAEIVALEIDQHDVLRPLLRMGGERGHLRKVLPWPSAPGPSPGNRSSVNAPSRHSHE